MRETRSARHQKKAKSKGVWAAPAVGLLALPFAMPLTSQATELGTVETTNQAAFIQQIAPYAMEVAQANDLYPSVMIAQALLETGYGSSALSQAPYYNLFGVKGYDGQNVVYLPTSEYLNGEWVVMNEPFRQYSSYYESFQDQANVLLSTMWGANHHYQGVWRSNTSSYTDATAWLTGRYATDPGYGSKLNSLIASYNLTQYDGGYSAPVEETAAAEVYQDEATTEAADTTVVETGTSEVATVGGTHTVVSGDTLWDIATNNGLTVDQLKALNGLTEDTIYVGEILALG